MDEEVDEPWIEAEECQECGADPSELYWKNGCWNCGNCGAVQ